MNTGRHLCASFCFLLLLVFISFGSFIWVSLIFLLKLFLNVYMSVHDKALGFLPNKTPSLYIAAFFSFFLRIYTRLFQ